MEDCLENSVLDTDSTDIDTLRDGEGEITISNQFIGCVRWIELSFLGVSSSCQSSDYRREKEVYERDSVVQKRLS